MTVCMWIATVAWICLIGGYLNRRDARRHVPLVLAAIVLDLGLVLYLQITRSAVQTAVEFSLTLPQKIHIISSSLAVALYIPMVLLGLKLFRNRSHDKTRTIHKRLAVAILLFRTLGFIFMFSMIKTSA